MHDTEYRICSCQDLLWSLVFQHESIIFIFMISPITYNTNCTTAHNVVMTEILDLKTSINFISRKKARNLVDIQFFRSTQNYQPKISSQIGWEARLAGRSGWPGGQTGLYFILHLVNNSTLSTNRLS